MFKIETSRLVTKLLSIVDIKDKLLVYAQQKLWSLIRRLLEIRDVKIKGIESSYDFKNLTIKNFIDQNKQKYPEDDKSSIYYSVTRRRNINDLKTSLYCPSPVGRSLDKRSDRKDRLEIGTLNANINTNLNTIIHHYKTNSDISNMNLLPNDNFKLFPQNEDDEDCSNKIIKECKESNLSIMSKDTKDAKERKDSRLMNISTPVKANVIISPNKFSSIVNKDSINFLDSNNLLDKTSSTNSMSFKFEESQISKIKKKMKDIQSFYKFEASENKRNNILLNRNSVLVNSSQKIAYNRIKPKNNSSSKSKLKKTISCGLGADPNYGSDLLKTSFSTKYL